jgi:hypothetical protein
MLWQELLLKEKEKNEEEENDTYNIRTHICYYIINKHHIKTKKLPYK